MDFMEIWDDLQLVNGAIKNWNYYTDKRDDFFELLKAQTRLKTRLYFSDPSLAKVLLFGNLLEEEAQ